MSNEIEAAKFVKQNDVVQADYQGVTYYLSKDNSWVYKDGLADIETSSYLTNSYNNWCAKNKFPILEALFNNKKAKCISE
jgi:hypothetical protein